MAKRASKRRPRTRARRSLLARTRPPVPRLELAPHHVDVIALALLALGIFLACIAYAGLNGGALGAALVGALTFLFGVIGYAVPAALLAAGGLVLARELRFPGRPLRMGAVCLLAGLTLAVAAGTLGIGPGRTTQAAFWHAHAFKGRGGVLGQAELWVSSNLVSMLGAQILAVFLLIAGVLLLSGATVAGVLRATGTGMERTTRVLARSGEQLGGSPPLQRAAALARRRHSRAATEPTAAPGAAYGPGPEAGSPPSML